MTVPAVTPSVDHAFFRVLRNPKFSCFVFIQRPEMIFFVKICLTSCRLIFLKLPVTVREQLPVAHRLDTHVLLLTGRAVSCKCKHVRLMFYDSIYDIRDLVDVCPDTVVMITARIPAFLIHLIFSRVISKLPGFRNQS